MRYRVLGRTGLTISELAFGAGPVSGLMTGEDHAAQERVLRRAADLGINWVDTAPGYGQGRSETNLGRALKVLGTDQPFHLATKVRLMPEQLRDVQGAVRRSVESSLARLGVSCITLLQLHNGLTTCRGEEPFSITPADVIQAGGLLDILQQLRSEGLVRFIGLTGTGQPAALRQVVRTGHFDTIQVPYHLLNPSAGQPMPEGYAETDYGHIIADCAEQGMGVLAIRIFAGGALLDQEPSPHTLQTPFFPRELYERDRSKAIELLGQGGKGKEAAIRFVLRDSRVHSAIVGFGTPHHIEELAGMVNAESS